MGKTGFPKTCKNIATGPQTDNKKNTVCRLFGDICDMLGSRILGASLGGAPEGFFADVGAQGSPNGRLSWVYSALSRAWPLADRSEGSN